MSDQRPIPQDDWETVVESVPIVSVDLVVRRGDAVLLGRRTNEPAKGRWFVPGGRVHRDERLADAVHRVADEELGVEVDIKRRLGAYEHFWAVSDTEDTDGKHYVPVGFVVTTDDDIHTDAQHDAVRWFSPPFDDVDLHPYVHDYLADAELVGE